MHKNVLTMPIGKSSLYTHEHGVYSIQKHRTMVEPLCQDPTQYFALRESAGGAMHWLYQVVSAPGLLLDPQQPLPAQISLWQEKLRSDQPKLHTSQKIRLANYIKAVTKNLGGDYRKVQLFYVLAPWQNDSDAGSAPVIPCGPLPRKPRPVKHHERPQSYSLEDVCTKQILT